jgi:hypothetical protein
MDLDEIPYGKSTLRSLGNLISVQVVRGTPTFPEDISEDFGVVD